ncbi:MAG: hypothetical protein A2Y69_04875 [Candidatus Aminicenantes bacterium RBG_13_59_9]|nr:MAG: hypothetical protein A2Y69_04875 [Candidatus Aminicenantes bacterium RBG_13_59_9]
MFLRRGAFYGARRHDFVLKYSAAPQYKSNTIGSFFECGGMTPLWMRRRVAAYETESAGEAPSHFG